MGKAKKTKHANFMSIIPPPSVLVLTNTFRAKNNSRKSSVVCKTQDFSFKNRIKTTSSPLIFLVGITSKQR